MDKDLRSRSELERLEREFSLLYEVSNAMRTTLKLDQILYIILTALTSHEGLGFNRAMLFLVNEREHVLDGVMGIGPSSGEEAGKIWHAIVESKMTLDDFIASYDSFKKNPESKLNAIVKGMKIPLREDMGILALTILEGMPFEITTDEAKEKVDTETQQALSTNFFVTIPLKAKDKVLGAILVDNIFNKKPITKTDMKILTMFANHAGLAIENSRLFEETVYLSTTDWLTKLFNYGKFQELLKAELDRAAVNDTKVSLVMVDVDNFKNYNDTLGHTKGDDALRTIAAILANKSRKFDHVARYGGEEFAIIMPNTKKENARLFAERLREEIANVFSSETRLPQEKRPTISSGISSFPEDSDSKEDLIVKADIALYEAKKAGRNRTCLYNSDMGNSKA